MVRSPSCADDSPSITLGAKSPGPEGGSFVEVEDFGRRSIRAGERMQRDDGCWVLRLRMGAAVAPGAD
jgi:hypothetical protein